MPSAFNKVNSTHLNPNKWFYTAETAKGLPPYIMYAEVDRGIRLCNEALRLAQPADAADLFCAAMVQPVGPGGGRGF
jgi:hypothetical protein